jgi:iron(III) transport system substrate-binding protein
VIVAIAAVWTAPVPAGAASKLAGQTIVLYNAQHEQTTNAIIAAFNAATGIKVKVQNNSEDVLTAQIQQEGSRSPADVFYSENSNWLQQLDNRGLLAKVPAATLANVPAQDSATNGRWVGVSARVSALVYNPSKISAAQLPTSVLQLADAKYKGEFELAPTETDFWPVVSSVAKAEGNAAALRWLKALKANAADSNVPDSETLVGDVNQGLTDFALVNQYYFYRLQVEKGAGALNEKLAYLAPGDPGYVENISGAAALQSSKHLAAAQAFLAFLTSRAGQSVIGQGDSFEYPLRPGVPARSELTPLSELHPAPFTPAELGTGLGAKQLLQQAGLI